jgi:hypothetical protein
VRRHLMIWVAFPFLGTQAAFGRLGRARLAADPPRSCLPSRRDPETEIPPLLVACVARGRPALPCARLFCLSTFYRPYRRSSSKLHSGVVPATANNLSLLTCGHNHRSTMDPTASCILKRYLYLPIASLFYRPTTTAYPVMPFS